MSIKKTLCINVEVKPKDIAKRKEHAFLWGLKIRNRKDLARNTQKEMQLDWTRENLLFTVESIPPFAIILILKLRFPSHFSS